MIHFENQLGLLPLIYAADDVIKELEGARPKLRLVVFLPLG
jgi:hypothetical protein